MSESLEIVKQTYETIVGISNTIPKIEDIKAMFNRSTNTSTNRKEEFNESEMIDHKASPSPEMINPLAASLEILNKKKVEEGQNIINDMSKQYSELITKFKVLEEEKENTAKSNKILQEEITFYTKEMTNYKLEVISVQEELTIYKDEASRQTERINSITTENSRLENMIIKQKDYEQCLVHTIKDMLFSKDKTENEEIKSKDINCEPLPSFVRFMKK